MCIYRLHLTGDYTMNRERVVQMRHISMMHAYLGEVKHDDGPIAYEDFRPSQCIHLDLLRVIRCVFDGDLVLLLKIELYLHELKRYYK